MKYNDSNNPYLQRLDLLEKARKAWCESEWRLQLLRTISATPPPAITDDQLLEWYKANQQAI